jgi:hypothetical protein
MIPSYVRRTGILAARSDVTADVRAIPESIGSTRKLL